MHLSHNLYFTIGRRVFSLREGHFSCRKGSLERALSWPHTGSDVETSGSMPHGKFRCTEVTFGDFWDPANATKLHRVQYLMYFDTLLVVWRGRFWGRNSSPQKTHWVDGKKLPTILFHYVVAQLFQYLQYCNWAMESWVGTDSKSWDLGMRLT